MFVKIKRIVRTGFFNFLRNGSVSLASVLVMVVALFTIGSIIFMSAILDSTMTEIKNKVDVNVYFTVSADEPGIMSIKKSLEALPEVAVVSYVSRDEALEKFKNKHANESTTLQAPEELGDNPLGAVLNIKAKDPSQYESISKFFDTNGALYKEGKNIVDTVNYKNNKDSIDTLSKIISSTERLGSFLILFLVCMAILITFNTIRLAIYTAREEISVMKLVGASNKYVRGPFVVTGVMYGLISAIITIIIFYPVTMWLSEATANFYVNLNVFRYYIAHIYEIAGVLILSGVFIGTLSSYMAVRRYLKV